MNVAGTFPVPLKVKIKTGLSVSYPDLFIEFDLELCEYVNAPQLRGRVSST